MNDHKTMMPDKKIAKKLEIVFLSILFLMLFTGCAGQNSDEKAESAAASETDARESAHTNTDTEPIWLVKTAGYDDHSGNLDMMEYEYDDQGRTISDTWYVIEANGNKKVYTYYTYTYDQRGNELHCIRQCPGEPMFEDFFDEDGRLLVTKHFSTSSKPTDITLYYYDENNKINKEVSHHLWDDGTEYVVTDFDSLGIQTRETYYKPAGITKQYDYPVEYEKDGNSASVSFDDGTKILYEFDDNGNKIKETKFDSKGQVLYESEYTYISMQVSSSSGIPRHRIY